MDVEAGSAGLVRVLAAASRCATAQVALGWARLRSSPHRPVDRPSRPERRRLRQVLAVLWELPQNQLGAGLLALHWVLGAVRSTQREHGRLFVESPSVAVSLGHFVFWTPPTPSRHFFSDAATRDHEYGHTFQSRSLGPLYLLAVGVPSVSRVIYAIAYRELTGRRWRGYFDGYPERQADLLGGVDRARVKTGWPVD